VLETDQRLMGPRTSSTPTLQFPHSTPKYRTWKICLTLAECDKVELLQSHDDGFVKSPFSALHLDTEAFYEAV